MKFRGLIVENAAMRDFQNISLSLSKFAKNCVLRLTTKKMYFIVSEEEGGPRRPLVWCELPITFYFKEYNVVGVSDVHNEIYLDLSTVLLARSCSVLKQDVKSFKIKLTNKGSPCLTLEMELPNNILYFSANFRKLLPWNMSGELLSRQCVHDIPVDVISRQHWGDYEEPKFNDFHVSIRMPNLKFIKNIVEKMKNMSHSLTVCANKEGKLTLKIKTSTVKLAAHFPNLSVNSFAEGHIPNGLGDDDENAGTVSSTIDIKKFLMFLSGMQLNNCQAVCNIVQGKMVKLYMEQPGALLLQIFLTELNV